MIADDGPETAERRYRMLLEVAEAANAHLDMDGVLAAVAAAVRLLVRVDAIGVVTLSGADRIRPYSMYGPVDLQRPGESIAQTMNRLLELSPENPDDYPEFPLAGSMAEFVRDTRTTYLCADVPADYRFVEREHLMIGGVLSAVCVPMFIRDSFLGSLVHIRRDGPGFDERDARLLEGLSQPVVAAVANSLAFREIQRLRALLARENVALREELDERGMFREIVGGSAALRDVLARVEKVAATHTTVIVLGETGTGKELIARAIHRRSARAKGPLVCVNCAALSPGLIASELFGHEKGAFTGATQRRVGRFEMAAGGTIFLDEIGDLPHEVQVSLLRVLQEGEYERVGGNRPLRTDARVIAATHRDLRAAVADGGFREDLYYRLTMFPIELPPLRERREDIPALVEHFVRKQGERRGLSYAGVEPASLKRMLEYGWPGNVRELANVIERAMILSDGGPLRLDARALAVEPLAGAPAPAWIAPGAGRGEDLRTGLRTLETQLIEAALQECDGRVAGPRGAAKRLGMPPATLDNKIRLYRIDKLRYRPRP